MPIEHQVDSYQADIARIVEDVFRTMLNLDAVLSEEAGPAAPGGLTVAVQFVGEWKGAIVLQCSEEQALLFTARLMPGRKPAGIDEDVRDCLGELANMVGGNLKSVLPHGVALSMPSVVAGSDYAEICGANAARSVGFSSEVGVFRVTLVQVAAGELIR